MCFEMRVLITGAAGNLGGMLAKYLLQQTDHFLNLMVHRNSLSDDLARNQRTKVYQCDLARPETLREACGASETIVHFAGVLFAPRPERFLPITNFLYTKNLVDTAIACGVKKCILISFPHVEGSTSREHPCTTRQDRQPVSMHANTRLAAEKYLIERASGSAMTAISLRPGMIYGKDVLMIAFARQLAQKRLLGVWNEPTPIHLLSIDDFNRCCQAAIDNPNAQGIYPLGDEEPMTLQEFLDLACQYWGLKRPWRVPIWSVYGVAWVCETIAAIAHTRTPFTVDFIRIGRVPYYCDTARMKADLLPRLRYPSIREGIEVL